MFEADSSTQPRSCWAAPSSGAPSSGQAPGPCTIRICPCRSPGPFLASAVPRCHRTVSSCSSAQVGSAASWGSSCSQAGVPRPQSGVTVTCKTRSSRFHFLRKLWEKAHRKVFLTCLPAAERCPGGHVEEHRDATAGLCTKCCCGPWARSVPVSLETVFFHSTFQGQSSSTSSSTAAALSCSTRSPPSSPLCPGPKPCPGICLFSA